MAQMGDTCGALTDGMMVLGLKFGRVVAGNTDAKEKNYRLVHEFVEKFNKWFENCYCRDLLGFNREAAEMLEEIIEQESG